ncbi:MAG: hypothetical protein NC189_02750 [Bacteroides sp.]|nr:hypothetical protein [Bacteroides sp.]
MIFLCGVSQSVSAQTVNVESLNQFPAGVVRDTYNVCQHVSLTPEQQIQLAKALQQEDADYTTILNANNGFMPQADAKVIEKKHDKALAKIMNNEQLEQYYRGVYNEEALAEGNAVANRLRKSYGLTDQNWKFIRNAFYKFALESRVIKKVMSDSPKKAESKIANLKKSLLNDIEQRGGIRVNPEGTTVEVVRQFDPNKLRKE